MAYERNKLALDFVRVALCAGARVRGCAGVTCRLKSGKVIRRPNDRPFRIVVRRKRK